MLGVVKYAPGVGKVELRELPEPKPGPGEVKVAVKAAGICGTDIHIWDNEYSSRPPVVLGHEFAGQVVELGDGVTGLAAGDRVTAIPMARTCGRCPYCHQGLLALCPERLSFGSGFNGAFAPYLVIPAGAVRKLPAQLDDESGALTEPFACCVKAVQELGSLRGGDLVLVIGPGPIGLLALQLAKAGGATTILVGTASDAQRLALGRTLGADYALQTERDDVAAVVNELSAGEGVDLALECAGVAAATRMALRLVRKRGQLIQMGLHGKPFEIDFEQIVYKDLRVVGSFASSAGAWDRAIVLLQQGFVQLGPLVSAVLPLAEWEKGFAMTRSKEGVKVLLRP